MSKLTILVTGSRHLTDSTLVERALAAQIAFSDQVLIVVGDCPTGADKFAQEAAQTAGVGCVTFAAKWGEEGKAAGPIRNKRMVDYVAGLDGDKVCLSFWKDGALDSETRNCVALAQSAGIHIIRHHEPVDRW